MTPNFLENDCIAVLLSGGLDSSLMLARLVADGKSVAPLYVRSGLFWEEAELLAVGRVLAWFADHVRPLTILDLPVRDIYGDHWSLTGQQIPDANSPDEAVYLPGRNLLLLVKAGLWCRQHGLPLLALGILDSNPFADASEEFLRTVETALNLYGPPSLQIIRPLQGVSKKELMKWGERWPLHETFSCIAPIEGLHCGGCNKCAERRRAFREAGIPDLTPYASDPNGKEVSPT
ncbi:7-cyano-7-deazaguanine synthase [Thermogutta sp.]|uniref:7-cyano-7-deazaguanine synthase n=1 Tax=Thermogutta sp. TaxID=1962930 RepID=UPI0032207452